MTFDIASFKVAETFDVEITNPATSEPLLGEGGKPCSITVYGPASKQFKAAQAVANAKMVKRIRSKGKVEETPEEAAASTASFLASITLKLNNFVFNGQAEGVETFRSMYADPNMGFVTEQVNREAGDWANFTQG